MGCCFCEDVYTTHYPPCPPCSGCGKATCFIIHVWQAELTPFLGPLNPHPQGRRSPDHPRQLQRPRGPRDKRLPQEMGHPHRASDKRESQQRQRPRGNQSLQRIHHKIEVELRSGEHSQEDSHERQGQAGVGSLGVAERGGGG